nr:MAG TPA: hypothetical protein [Caudoviricetes sp.]
MTFETFGVDIWDLWDYTNVMNTDSKKGAENHGV